MAKKNDLPAMPFYFGDWRKAGEIRALDLDVRMIWFEMLGYMWESTERGYLTLNGKPVSTSVISKMVGVDITKMEQALSQLEEYNVFSRREDGAIFNRKMVKDEELRRAKSAAGAEGMKKRYGKGKANPVITPDITEVVTKPEIENEIEDINKKEREKLEKDLSESTICIYDFVELESRLCTSSQVASLNSISNSKFSEQQIVALIKQFVAEQKAKGNFGKSLFTYKTYLVNWFKIEINRPGFTATNPSSKQMSTPIGGVKK